MDKTRIKYGLLIFLINPVLGVWTSIRNFIFPESKFILILFFGLFGATMIFSEGKDGHRHASRLELHYVDKDLSTFLEETKNIIFNPDKIEEGFSKGDLYIHIISFLVAPISTGTAGLYLVVALIYGSFYIRSISKIYNEIKGHWNGIIYILFLVFIFWKSFEGINSIRNWTAAWIYFYSAVSYLQSKKKKYIIYILMTPLVHFSYLIMILPFFIVIFFGNRPKIYVILLILSFFYSVSNLPGIMELISYSKLGAQKIDQYVREGEAESYLIERSSQAFHAKYYLIAGKIFISILFYYSISTLGYINKTKHSYMSLSLASVAILSIAISNLSTNIYALYSRMFNNAGLYVLAYLIIMYHSLFKDTSKKISIINFNVLTILTLPFAILFVFTQWSQIGEFTDIRILISPIFYPFIGNEDMSLKELIKLFIV